MLNTTCTLGAERSDLDFGTENVSQKMCHYPRLPSGTASSGSDGIWNRIIPCSIYAIKISFPLWKASLTSPPLRILILRRRDNATGS